MVFDIPDANSIHEIEDGVEKVQLLAAEILQLFRQDTADLDVGGVGEEIEAALGAEKRRRGNVFDFQGQNTKAAGVVHRRVVRPEKGKEGGRTVEGRREGEHLSHISDLNLHYYVKGIPQQTTIK